MMPRARQAGFTLLEAALAIGLGVVLLGSLYGYYHHVCNVRKNVLHSMEFYNAERQVMDRITYELQAAVPYPFLASAMEGQVVQPESPDQPVGGTEIRFFSTVLPGPAVWVAPSVGEDPPPPEHDVQWVGYSLQIYVDDEGNWHNDGLTRTVQRLLTLSTVLEETAEGEKEKEPADAEIVSELLAPAVKFFFVQYYDGAAWVDVWAGDTLPVAVEVIMGSKPLEPGMDVVDYLADPERFPVFRRTVFLPAGTRIAAQDEASAGGEDTSGGAEDGGGGQGTGQDETGDGQGAGQGAGGGRGSGRGQGTGGGQGGAGGRGAGGGGEAQP